MYRFVYILENGELFSLLAKQTTHGRAIILFDEISWMAHEDPDFLGKLKIIWDEKFSNNDELMLILCGSVSSWIEENILSSTGYLGRPTLHMTLNELPLSDCKQFWGAAENQVSDFEKLKYLSVTGGVPRYLELMNPRLTADDNIKYLCFTKDGPLFDEFNKIFTDIYTKSNTNYRKIIESLLQGKGTQETISKNTGIPISGDLSEYLFNLEVGGFITREHTWSLKTGKISSLSYYRLKDNYTRFYLKYIFPNKARIQKGRFIETSLTALPAWDSIVGLQFENLVLNNADNLLKVLNITPENIVFDNPFFQRKTLRQPGVQIDYLIQTKHNTVYICEIKFSRYEITPSIIEEVEEKIKRLKLPKYMSYRPVLICVNDVREDVIDSDYFSHIIHFGDLFDN